MDNSVRVCLWCNVDISHLPKNARYCCLEHSNKSYNQRRRNAIIESKKNRVCELCDRDISNMNSNARYCCREHKEKHYRFLNRDKVNEWKSDWQKNNNDKIRAHKKEVADKERLEYGFTKNYLRNYARRHINDLLAIKKLRCFKCKTKQYLGIHHVKYTKNPEDWEFVCRECHTLIHEPTSLF